MEYVPKCFDEKTMLNDVSLQVRKDKFVTILGPSDCGKTILLRSITSFQTTSEGVIAMSGKETTQAPPHKRPVDTASQKYILSPHLNVCDNIASSLRLKKLPSTMIGKKMRRVLKMVGLTGYENRNVDFLSGGQRRRMATARVIISEPEMLLLDKPLAALDLEMRKDMQMELEEMYRSLGIMLIYVAHNQKKALTLSDTIAIMNEGEVQQTGTSIDTYSKPVSSFVTDLIGESSILNGTMIEDRQASLAGHEFEYVDERFREQIPVDVVLHPEGIYVFEPSGATMLAGTVTSSILKGMYYGMMVQTPNEYGFMVQGYHYFEAGSGIGFLIRPFDIHIMRKEHICNAFERKLIGATYMEFLDYMSECREVTDVEPNAPMKVEVDFKSVVLEDDEENSRLAGEVRFIPYKGNHCHLTIFTDWDEDIFVDTSDIWDDGDHVGIATVPGGIQVIHV